jgi:tripartite-type tricarboxylate transporter receptor subunit TctC
MPGRTIAVFGAFVAATAPAAADDWPAHPVTMVVPFAAGGGVDVIGRILSPRLSELLGRQVVIENVGGAGGLTGAARVAKAAPDGYQFVLGNVGTHAVNQTLYKNPPYHPVDDFAPVALIAEQPTVLIARKDFPASDLRSFLAYAKAHPMLYGSGGAGSAMHIACVVLSASGSIKATHVPYRGGGPAMTDMIGGRIDYGCPTAALALPNIEGGQVKALAMLSKERSPILPSLPSAAEQGLANVEVDSWYAFFLPRGTPAPIVQKLHNATVAAMDTPAVRERLKELGATVVAPARRSPEYLKTFVESEIVKWAAPIRAAGIVGE